MKDHEKANDKEMTFDIAQLTYYPLLKEIIKDYTINENNFQNKIQDYKRSHIMTHLEEKLFELFLYVHPKKENFKSELNRKYIINLLKYFFKKKGGKKI